ncbi:MAG: glucose-6-phosphate isomerase [Halobacteriales archaeon]
MDVDLGHALAPDAIPGVRESSLERLDRAVAEAHDRILAGVDEERFGYAALGLGERVDPGSIRAAVGDHRVGDPVVVVGMGGSALGARAVAGALAPSADWLVLDSIDPAYVRRRLEAVDLERALVHVVSRSGATVETRALFRLVREAMADAGVDWTARTVATTTADGPLGEAVADAGVPRLDPPRGVPGRYSVLSSMALPSAAALGVDIEGLLAGGRRAAVALEGSLFDVPGYAYGATMAALAARGATQSAFVVYREALVGVAHWYAQLWAESLGKDGLGQTPIPGRGVADHHSQLQRWRDGRRDLVVSTLAVPPTDDLSVPGDDDLGRVGLGELLELERRGAEASLAAARRPTVGLELERLDAEALGGLFVDLEAACIMYAELAGIDPFDQPAVEWGKQAVRDALADRETDRTRRLREAGGFRISR